MTFGGCRGLGAGLHSSAGRLYLGLVLAIVCFRLRQWEGSVESVRGDMEIVFLFLHLLPSRQVALAPGSLALDAPDDVAGHNGKQAGMLN